MSSKEKAPKLKFITSTKQLTGRDGLLNKTDS